MSAMRRRGTSRAASVPPPDPVVDEREARPVADEREVEPAAGAREPEPGTGGRPVSPRALVLRDPGTVPDAPPPEIRFRRALKLGRALRSLWRSRHIVWSLAVREMRSQYNQEILGVAWALLAPLTLMVVFTVLFERVGKVNTHGVPYPLFSYVGLVVWTFFSNSVQGAGLSLVNQPLLNKVYAPREVFPLAEVVVAGFSAVCATFALALLFVVEDHAPAANSYWVPVLVAILLAFTVAACLFVSSITVYLRDVRHALPLGLQLGLFVTPVVYSLSEIPSGWRAAYVAVNPLGAVVEGLRQSVLMGQAPDAVLTVVAAAAAAVYLLGGFALFKRLETGFADVS